MIKNKDDFADWVRRNSKKYGDKTALYKKVSFFTGVPYHTVRSWGQTEHKPNQAVYIILNKHIQNKDLPS